MTANAKHFYEDSKLTTEPQEPAHEIARPAPKKTPPRRAIVGALVALGVLGGSAAWYATVAGHETTDDAQVDAEVVAVPARAAGTVSHLYFKDNQLVHEGEVLATLDDEVAKARLAQAEAALASAIATAEAAEADARVAEASAKWSKAAADATVQSSSAAAVAAKNQIAEAEAASASADATLRQAQIDVDRNRSLYASGAIARVAMDQYETQLAVARANADAARARLSTLRSGVAQAAGHVVEASARARQVSDVESFIAQARARAGAARAQVETAKAARDLAAIDLSFTRILAPHDGVVSKKTIAEGQAVAAGQSIVQLVTPGVWITANFKETQLERMRPGQHVEIAVDAFPKAKVRGEIESMSGGTGSRFTLLPPDNAAGNFTKVVQRVPVRIRIDTLPDGIVLRPGMSVDVNVDTRS